MVFPDYFFFAERRLVNHTIHKKPVKNLNDCELFCYMNDNCVSRNFKKDPENNKPVHICELSNATHLKYDSDLTTDANFYYRGSNVSYKSIFSKLLPQNNIKTIIHVYAHSRAFNHSVFSFFFLSLFHFFFPLSERL